MVNKSHLHLALQSTQEVTLDSSKFASPTHSCFLFPWLYLQTNCLEKEAIGASHQGRFLPSFAKISDWLKRVKSANEVTRGKADTLPTTVLPGKSPSSLFSDPKDRGFLVCLKCFTQKGFPHAGQ